MKKTVWFPVLILLESIALEVGAYTLSALEYQERLHILLETVILCLIGGIVTTVVARPKTQALSSFLLALGVVALCIGFYFLTILGYHERAYVTIGIGLICSVGGLAGLIIPRSLHTALWSMIALGVVALGIGSYFLAALGYHGRAYMVIGMGIVCILAGFMGVMAARRKSQAA